MAYLSEITLCRGGTDDSHLERTRIRGSSSSGRVSGGGNISRNTLRRGGGIGNCCQGSESECSLHVC
jgi:hypothetical protein